MAGSGYGRVTGWVGWIWFAAIMLIMVGVFNIIDGLAALFKDDYYVITRSGQLLAFNFTTWGWIHLLLGIVLTVTGFFLFSGKLWARIVAICAATLNAIAQLAFLSAYPIWSVLIIALDVLVIWALTVHGEEAAAANL